MQWTQPKPKSMDILYVHTYVGLGLDLGVGLGWVICLKWALPFARKFQST